VGNTPAQCLAGWQFAALSPKNFKRVGGDCVTSHEIATASCKEGFPRGGSLEISKERANDGKGIHFHPGIRPHFKVGCGGGDLSGANGREQNFRKKNSAGGIIQLPKVLPSGHRPRENPPAGGMKYYKEEQCERGEVNASEALLTSLEYHGEEEGEEKKRKGEIPRDPEGGCLNFLGFGWGGGGGIKLKKWVRYSTSLSTTEYGVFKNIDCRN